MGSLGLGAVVGSFARDSFTGITPLLHGIGVHSCQHNKIWNLFSAWSVRLKLFDAVLIAVWVLALIELVGCAIIIGGSIFQETFGQDALGNIIALVLAGLMFWVANNIKTQAGK